MIVVDDQLLFSILAHKPSPALEELATNGIATTSSWYFRLARAIATGRAEGSLSRLMTDLNETEQQPSEPHSARFHPPSRRSHPASRSR